MDTQKESNENLSSEQSIINLLDLYGSGFIGTDGFFRILGEIIGLWSKPDLTLQQQFDRIDELRDSGYVDKKLIEKFRSYFERSVIQKTPETPAVKNTIESGKPELKVLTLEEKLSKISSDIDHTYNMFKTHAIDHETFLKVINNIASREMGVFGTQMDHSGPHHSGPPRAVSIGGPTGELCGQSI